jgi:hypothetical protein
MSTLLFAVAVAVVVGAAVLWAAARARRIRAEAQERESHAMAAMLGRNGADGETIFGGLPPARGGIEVAEMAEVVDLDALLAGEPGVIANRARAQLEEPTNIDIGGLDTSPLLPARTPLLPARSPVVPLPAVAARPVPARAPAAAPSPVAVAPPARTAVEPRPSAPISAPPAPVATPTVRAPAPVPVPAARPVAGPPTHPGEDVPLRELALAWFEARGYRSAPASPAVRPIELVLRHKDDPARAYAFVVESNRVSSERVQALRGQARAIGLVRLLIVAAGGAVPRAAEGFKGVRLMDRPALEAEFKQLDISVAAKIIAVARKRSGALAATAG